jgi:hypothetical protein
MNFCGECGTKINSKDKFCGKCGIEIIMEEKTNTIDSAKKITPSIELSLIQNNPYRILGIPIISSERELQKQITKSNRFAEVGKTITSETDYPFLGELERSVDSINLAAKSIEQPLNKILYSTFWFLNGNHIDNVAMESLQKDNFDKAIGIWEKVIGNGEISDKKFSNLLNLKTLYLGLSSETKKGVPFKKGYFIKGIELSGKFINHKEFKPLCKKIVGEKFNFSIEKIEDMFLSSILTDIKPFISNGIEINEIIDAVGSFSADTQFKFSQKFSAGETNRIEKEIENSENLRNKNPGKAYEFALDLYKNTKDDIKSLAKIIGNSDVKYEMIANKLANELIQCAIEFFNEKNNRITNDVAVKAYVICKYAKSIVAGGPTKERIDQNLKIIKESSEQGIDTSNYPKNIISHVNKICRVLEKSVKAISDGNSFNKLTSAKELVRETKDSRLIISEAVGSDDKGYVKICDTIVSISLSLLIDYVNKMASVIGVDNEQISFLRSLGHLPMEPATKSRYQENLKTLNGMYNRSNSGGGGCYIATMVYGDYDHPQVMILRNFRDNFLSNYFLGRNFIQFYYKYSPSWVETMKNTKVVNFFIRFVLNKIILIIKK